MESQNYRIIISIVGNYGDNFPVLFISYYVPIIYIMLTYIQEPALAGRGNDVENVDYMSVAFFAKFGARFRWVSKQPRKLTDK